MRTMLLTLAIGLWMPTAFANQYSTSHVDCENGRETLEKDLKHSCKRLFLPQKDVIMIAITTHPEVTGVKNNKITSLACGYQVTYVCADHVTDSCDQAEANYSAVMDGYDKAVKLKDEDLQAYADAIHSADDKITQACKLAAPKKTRLDFAPTATASAAN